MEGFRVTVQGDGTCTWHGLSTGHTTLVQYNHEQRAVLFHVAGHRYWSSRGQAGYAPAHFEGYTVDRVLMPGGGMLVMRLGSKLFEFQTNSGYWQRPNIEAIRSDKDEEETE
jgi:hypothetical protein